MITAVDGIKIDFVNYKYPLLAPFITVDTIRLASKKDIAAMKLNAISGRGSKKDFIDLYFLLKYFSLQEMFEFYNQKYQDGSEFMVLKSLLYFEDADLEATPKMLLISDWETIKKSIVMSFDKI